MITISIALIAGCIIEGIFVNKSFDDLIDSLEAYQVKLDENKDKIDTDELIYEINEINENWTKKIKYLKSLIWHSGIKDIEIGVARLIVYVEENDYTEASAELSSMIEFLKYYSEDFSFAIENVF